jgi:hypothetical protein
MTELLLGKGADTSIKNAAGEMVEDVALKNKIYNLADRLEKGGSSIHQKIHCQPLPDIRFSNSPMRTGCYECACVLDTLSHLVWAYPLEGSYTLQAARVKVSSMNEEHYLGRSDWRIPGLDVQKTLLTGPSGAGGRGFLANHPFYSWGESGTTFYWNSGVPEPRYIEYTGWIKGRELVMDDYSVINFKYRSTFRSNYTKQDLWVVAGPLSDK